MFQGTERYEVIRKLGEGGFGEVYEVRDRQLDRRVALKTMARDSAKHLVAFKREFRRFAELLHPNVVRLFELGQDATTAFFTMELVSGGRTWPDHVREQGSPSSQAFDGEDVALDETLEQEASAPFEAERLLRSLAELIDGLDAIHALGFVHRDVKPANVLVSDEGCVKVLDFGLAGADADSDHTRTAGGFRGTPLYMAPEQMERVEITAAADWYALGVMLFEAVSGVPPFAGTLMQVLSAKATSAIRPVEVSPGQARTLLDIACALMTPRPQDREPAMANLRRCVAPYLGARSGASLASRSSQEDGEAPGSGQASVEPRQRCLGREAELELLTSRLEETTRGGFRITMVIAESGVGKSTMLREHARRQRAEGDWVFSGRCGPRESIPFKMLDPVVDSIAERLSRLDEVEAAALLPRDIRALADIFPALLRLPRVERLPSRRQVASTKEQLAVGATALSDLLGAMSDRRRTTLIFDDVQWGDNDSLAVIRALMGGQRPPSCHFIFAARREELDRSQVMMALLHSFERFAEEPSKVARLELEPLAMPICIAIATEQLGDAAQAQDIAQAAEGNAFFLDLLIRSVQDALVGDAQFKADQGGLVSLLAARLEALGIANADVLGCIAIAGRSVSEGLIRRVTRRSKGEVSEALETLVMRGLVRRSSGEESLFEPYHDRVTEAVRHNLSDAQARSLHVALAEAMRALTDADDRALDMEFVFTHLVDAGRLVEALPFATGAFTQARSANALHHTAALARLGIRCALAAGEDATDHFSRLAHVQTELMQYDEAIATLEEAEKTCADHSSLLLKRRGVTLVFTGRTAEGEAALRPLLASHRVRIPRTRPGLWISSIWAILCYAVAVRFIRFDRRSEGASEDCVFYHFLSSAYYFNDVEKSVWAAAIALKKTIREGKQDDLRFAKGVWETATSGVRGLRVITKPEEFSDIRDPVLAIFSHVNLYVQQTVSGSVRDCRSTYEALTRSVDLADPVHLLIDFTAIPGTESYSGELRRGSAIASARVLISGTPLAFQRASHAIIRQVEVLGDPPVGTPYKTRPQDFLGRLIEVSSARIIAIYRGDPEAMLCCWRSICDGGIRAQKPIFELEAAFLHLAAFRSGPPPSRRRIQKLASTLPGCWGALANVLLAGYAFVNDDLAAACELLERAIHLLEQENLTQYAAPARAHLARLVEVTNPEQSQRLQGDADAYFEREQIKDPVRFSLAMIPGFRRLYEDRPDLDQVLEGPTLLPWATPDKD